jgi:hypothetical protein
MVNFCNFKRKNLNSGEVNLPYSPVLPQGTLGGVGGHWELGGAGGRGAVEGTGAGLFGP